MLFPRTIFADRNTIWQQWRHLLSEVIELAIAIFKAKVCEAICDFDPLANVDIRKRWNHAANEAVDCQASSDTLLRILQEKYSADSDGAYTRVNINNTKRGYYGEANGRTISE